MKHLILILIAVLAMFTFWRTAAGTLGAGEHRPTAALFVPPQAGAPENSASVPAEDAPAQ
ncbi:MAG: hypothetical protein LBG74_07560 [Spirochaetaceae bacterium]|jgi:hypothetical protein|nr:hypothetical protein [Spirochaetaceae bacterium]